MLSLSRSRALRLAALLGERLSDRDNILDVISGIDGSHINEWSSLNLDIGDLGLALTLNELYQIDASDSYESAVQGFICPAIDHFNGREDLDFNLYGRNSIVGLALVLNHITKTFDYYKGAAAQVTTNLLLSYKENEVNSLRDAEFVYGLAGNLRAFLYLSRIDEQYIPLLSSAKANLLSALESKTIYNAQPLESFYLGNSHGLAGILSAMCACNDKIFEVHIHELSKFILSHLNVSDSGYDFPDVVDTPKFNDRRRNFGSWCHSGLSTAWVINKAGRRVNESLLIQTSELVYESYLRRFRVDDSLRDTNFCHGLSSLVALGNRFHCSNDSVSEMNSLALDKLLNLVDESLPFLFRQSIRPVGVIDHPGSLGGAASIALTLCSDLSYEEDNIFDTIWNL